MFLVILNQTSWRKCWKFITEVPFLHYFVGFLCEFYKLHKHVLIVHPDSVQDFKARVLNSRTVELQWKAPTRPGVSLYRVINCFASNLFRINDFVWDFPSHKLVWQYFTWFIYVTYFHASSLGSGLSFMLELHTDWLRRSQAVGQWFWWYRRNSNRFAPRSVGFQRRKFALLFKPCSECPLYLQHQCQVFGWRLRTIK